MCKEKSMDFELEKFMDEYYKKHGDLMKELEKK